MTFGLHSPDSVRRYYTRPANKGRINDIAEYYRRQWKAGGPKPWKTMFRHQQGEEALDLQARSVCSVLSVPFPLVLLVTLTHNVCAQSRSA
jgi:hypothetical protein